MPHRSLHIIIAPLCFLTIAIPLKAQDDSYQFSVQVVPVEETVLSSQLMTNISKLEVREGSRFSSGEILVRMQCDDQQVELERAKANHIGTEAKYKSAMRMKELSAASTIELSNATAEYKSSAALIKQLELQVKKCTILAPFDGRIMKSHIKPYQFVKVGDQLLEIADDTSLHVEALVPSSWLVWLRKDDDLMITIDEVQKDYAATVSYIGSSVNPVSQLVRIEAVISAYGEDLLIGMSGVGQFKRY